MRLRTRILLVPVVLLAGAMAWGYWHVSTHAFVDVQIHDHGLATNNLAYDTPHNATLEFFDASGSLLAVAKTVEPNGYLSTQHPTLGDCSSFQGAGGEAYSACYSDYSRWSSGWATGTRTATFKVGNCVLPNVPVIMMRSKTGWESWWVPLPHSGGKPFEYVQLAVDVDSKACSIVPAGR
ncbi:MAG: hypothetical protein NT117_06365 [Gammaproteobacteria bacterium]|nr:hypothetical protein [Gammaproteobacteria bacterium]